MQRIALPDSLSEAVDGFGQTFGIARHGIAVLNDGEDAVGGGELLIEIQRLAVRLTERKKIEDVFVVPERKRSGKKQCTDCRQCGKRPPSAASQPVVNAKKEFGHSAIGLIVVRMVRRGRVYPEENIPQQTPVADIQAVQPFDMSEERLHLLRIVAVGETMLFV